MIDRIPPEYAVYRFPSQIRFHDFAQITGHGSICQYLDKGVLACIYEGRDERGCSELLAIAARYGAIRCKKQPTSFKK